MLKPVDELDEILAELRSRHRMMQPPPFPAARLQKETALLRARSQWLRLGWPVAAAAAAFFILILARPGVRTDGVHPKRNIPSPHATTAPVPETFPAQFAPRPLAAAPVSRKRRAPRKSSEATTEFIDLPGTSTLPASAETSILRVELTKGDLRQYGFDVPPQMAAEIVRADFMVGSDGLARAIRLVL